MADLPITGLPANAALTGAEIIPAVQGGTTGKSLISAVGTYVRGLFTSTPATIAEGGTGAATAAAARTALSVVQAPTSSSDGLTYVVRNGVVKPYFIWPGYVSGGWYAPDLGLTPNAGSATVSNTIYFSPLVIYEKVTISTLEVTTTTTGTNCGLAIYPMDPTTKRPLVGAAPLAQTATFAVATATTYQPALTAPVTLDPGLYWIGHNTDAATTLICQTSTQAWAMNYTGASTGSFVTSVSNAGKYHFTLAQTFGTWPTTGTPVEVSGSTHAAYVGYLVSGVF